MSLSLADDFSFWHLAGAGLLDENPRNPTADSHQTLTITNELHCWSPFISGRPSRRLPEDTGGCRRAENNRRRERSIVFMNWKMKCSLIDQASHIRDDWMANL